MYGCVTNSLRVLFNLMNSLEDQSTLQCHRSFRVEQNAVPYVTYLLSLRPPGRKASPALIPILRSSVCTGQQELSLGLLFSAHAYSYDRNGRQSHLEREIICLILPSFNTKDQSLTSSSKESLKCLPVMLPQRFQVEKVVPS